MKRLVLFIALALCVTFAGTAQAATATGTWGVFASVAAAGTCTVVGGGNYFGTIVPPISADIDPGISSMSITCPSNTPYSIAFSAGGSGNFAQRQMSETTTPANKLNYNIYTDSTFASIWGDGTGSTVTVSGNGTGSIQNFNPAARAPAQATPAPGEYQDLLTITVTY